jgi:uncharacterized protein YlbG (UPF0298 family)
LDGWIKKEAVMYTNRMSFIVYYQGHQVLEKLQTLPIDVIYISEKQGYVVFYADNDIEPTLRKQLKNMKGFKFLGTSQTFDKNLNF